MNMNSAMFFMVIMAAVISLAESGARCEWKTYPDGYVAGNTNERIRGISLVECKERCIKAEKFKCASIDYEKVKNICHLSTITMAEALEKNLHRESEVYDILMLECAMEADSPWEITTCDEGTKSSDTGVLLDGTFGIAKERTHCQALFPSKTIAGTFYQISVDVKNIQGPRGVNSGHPGVLFNAKDSNNFDMVYFRPHWSGGCYQTGYKKDGKWVAIKTGRCPGGPPKGGVWFNFMVQVNKDQAKVYLNKKLVLTYKPHYSALGMGGVFIWNGYNNIADYENFTITGIPFETKSCDVKTEILPNRLLLDGTFGHRNDETHCQALSSILIPGNYYQISVDIKNIQGVNGNRNIGHPGIFFNVKDPNNYDMVYIRPHSSGGCYQTGYKKNGKWVEMREGKCAGGNPKGGVWFNLMVQVMKDNVKVYLNKKLIHQYKPHYMTKGSAGVFLWNGYNNIAEYKNFRMTSLIA